MEYKRNISGYCDHTKTLFAENKILPLDEIIKFAGLKLMYNFTHNRLQTSFHVIS